MWGSLGLIDGAEIEDIFGIATAGSVCALNYFSWKITCVGEFLKRTLQFASPAPTFNSSLFLLRPAQARSLTTRHELPGHGRAFRLPVWGTGGSSLEQYVIGQCESNWHPSLPHTRSLLYCSYQQNTFRETLFSNIYVRNMCDTLLSKVVSTGVGESVTWYKCYCGSIQILFQRYHPYGNDFIKIEIILH